MSETFGELAPSPAADAVRKAASRLGDNWFGRRAASLALRLAGGKARRAYDVEIFGGARARLHPYDNISEKRVFITPQFWEAAERAALADFMRERSGDFVFLDVGANAGLYTLFAHAEATRVGRPFRGVAVEPSVDMLARLRFNLHASGLQEDVRVFPVAVAGEAGEAGFEPNERNRGESRVASGGAVRIFVRTLTDIVDEAGAPRIDALKIDIEGGEAAALAPFFGADSSRNRPALIIAELSHAGDGGLSALIEGAGYRLVRRTDRNGVFRRVAQE